MTKKSPLAAQLHDYVASQTAERDRLQVELDSLQARKAFLLAAPLSAEDFDAVVELFIDTQAKHFLKASGVQRYKDRIAYPYVNDLPKPGRDPLSYADVLSLQAGRDDFIAGVTANSDIVFGSLPATHHHLAMCFYFPDVIKARIVALYRELGSHLIGADADRVGPSMEERRAEIDVIDARIREIESAIAAIDADLGLLKSATKPRKDQVEEQEADARLARTVQPHLQARIRREFRGHNHDALAQRYGCTVFDINAIVNRRDDVLQ